MTALIHEDARTLWSSTVAPDERVLVIGATGWFGRTATALLRDHPVAPLLVASRARAFTAGDTTGTAVAWSLAGVEAFAPTLVLDCAFLTRDLTSAMPLEEYVERNTALTANLLAAAALPSVSRVVTISSGAAVHPVDALTLPIAENPYGRLKREAEAALGELAAERGIAAVIARAWSVSGAFVQKPRSYALTDMVLQALEGGVRIAAPMPVFRRYVAVEDLLAVSLASAASIGTTLVDSAGELVEMQELAEAVVAVVNPRATIERAPQGDAPANRYYADPAGWDSRVAALGFRAATLPEQIAAARAGIAP